MVLFDDNKRENLFPLLFTRPAGALRVGTLTIAEKWEKRTGFQVYFDMPEYLKVLFTTDNSTSTLRVNGRLLPDARIVDQLLQLNNGEALIGRDGELLGYQGDTSYLASFNVIFKRLDYSLPYSILERPYDLFRLNGQELEKDFEILTYRRTSANIEGYNTLIHEHRIFAEPGVKVLCSTLNAYDGSIYLGEDAEIMEGSHVRGGFSLGEQSTLKMASKIYGPTTIGPHCKVGGEVNNAVFLGYSNKAHDGFLGNAVIGEWCNLGADSNNSNLKNNYEKVKLWNYASGRFDNSGLQFCGLIMGDHSKCGINTMFNTGTVVGVSANIFGSGFPRNFVPSFAWGGASGFETFALKKAFEVAERVYERRGLQFGDAEKSMLENVFEQTAQYRNWENQKNN